MKNKWKRFVAWLEGNPVTKVIVMFFRALWRLLAHNFGLKVLALLIAVLMWNFVLTSDTSITRSKTISGLTCYISNQSALKTYGLALLDNPTEELSNISVVVEVPQADYAYATADNVQVTLDLSGIRTAGTREVRLKASTSYGKVVRILPDTIPLTFEALDSRQIPINVQISGEIRDDMWYNINRSNPSSVTISGAASVVQNIAKAYVYVDVTGAEQSFEVPERYVLLDRDGNEISQSMLDRSSTSVSASVDVYPTKEIPISTDAANVVTGQPAAGYVVGDITIQPETLTVAADHELLEGVEELHVDPISVEGATQSFTVKASVASLSSFKFISAEEVYVNVAINEETVGAWVEDVDVSYANKGENLTITEKTDKVRVYVTGPRSAVSALQEAGFAATVDLSGLTAGSYEETLTFPTDAYPSVTFTPEVNEVRVVLADASAVE